MHNLEGDLFKGLIYSDLNSAEDYDLWFRAIRDHRDVVFQNLNEVCVILVKHASNLSSGSSSTELSRIVQLSHWREILGVEVEMRELRAILDPEGECMLDENLLFRCVGLLELLGAHDRRGYLLSMYYFRYV
jgi:hypothetical protein